MSLPANLSELIFDDDKKYRAAKLCAGFGFPSLRNGITSKDMTKVLKCPFKAYACFLIVCYVAYTLKGGNLIRGSNRDDQIVFVSCCLEALGLISVGHKISQRGHVHGVSGVTMFMIALTYTMREFEQFVLSPMPFQTVNGMFIAIFRVFTMLLSWVVLWSVWKTYRSSYQEELDVLKAKYLIPGCLALAVVMHPVFRFRQGHMYSLSWATSFYIDVLALLPQVVMMARSNGKIEAPVANFVAATAFSRLCDLWFWYYHWDRMAEEGHMFGYNVTGIIIVIFHVVSLALVADFMYYYFKARINNGSDFSKDIEIPMDDIA